MTLFGLPLSVLAAAALLGFAFAAAFFLFTKRSSSSSAAHQLVALSPSEYRSFPLIERTKLPSNSYRFRFALPTPQHRLGLSCGKHMLLRFKDVEGKPVSRPYTPTTLDSIHTGHFDLVIKIYPLGKMGPHLEALPLNSTVDVRGPLGDLHYKGHSVFSLKSKSTSGQFEWRDRTCSHINMIAGGTGITPMYQVMQEICKSPQAKRDKTRITLLYASQTENDILLKQELDEMQAAHGDKVKIIYTIDRMSNETVKWTGETGFITTTMIEKYLTLQSGELTLMCGPKPMIDFLSGNLAQLQVKPDNIFKF